MKTTTTKPAPKPTEANQIAELLRTRLTSKFVHIGDFSGWHLYADNEARTPVATIFEDHLFGAKKESTEGHQKRPKAIARRIVDAWNGTVDFDLEILKTQLADEACIGDLESFCSWRPARYFDTSDAHVDEINREQIARVVRYLELRGLITHHPKHPAWVRLMKPKGGK